jgi:transposase-like protein
LEKGEYMLFEEELSYLLKPGYMPMESGYYRLPNGQMYVAALTPMPGCKGQWVDWWFGTYLKNTETFKQWEPGTLCFKWDEAWRPGHYLGASTYVETSIGNRINKQIRKYEDPAKFFDISKFDEARVEAMVCGENFTEEGCQDGRVVHMVRYTDYGCEMRSRFWINNGSEETARQYLETTLKGMPKLAESLKIWLKNSSESGNDGGIVCKYCHSDKIVRNGFCKNSQYWLCKNCGRCFIHNQCLPKMRYPAHIVASAVQSYFDGCSLGHVCSDIEKNTNILPSTSTVYGWVKKLAEKASQHDVLTHPRVSDKWIIYETESWLKERRFWLVFIIDADSHFLLAAKFSNKLDSTDITSLIQSAKEKAGKLPEEILTNIGEEYLDGIESVYDLCTKHHHITSITDTEIFTSFIRDLSHIIRDRLKPAYAIDINDNTQTVLNGFVFHYNYVGLPSGSCRTPAEAAGIGRSIQEWKDVVRS